VVRVQEAAVGAIGHYTIERELGRGATATVYLARDPKHDRRVALKVLKPDLAAAVGADRFLREIRLLARLQHPHILPLFDSGEANGTLYLVTPYIEGESLHARLARDGPLPMSEALRIARDLLGALAYAHANGVVHRDIKPENVLLVGGAAAGGRVQPILADFGIARAIGRASGALRRVTDAGMVLGTPAYMSPEQASGEPELDGRTDIYSLGCVLYEMLAGAPPFTGATPQAVIAQRFTAAPPPLRARRNEVPAGLESVVMRALETAPEARWQTAEEFTAALTLASGYGHAISRGRGGASRPRGVRLPTHWHGWALLAAATALAGLAILVAARSLG
jgi:eukaryotic-like serine/threonine-protein kinase